MLHILIVLLLTAWASGSLRGQSSLNGHAVRLDSNGKLLAWPTVQGDAYDQVLRLATNFLLNGVPTAPNGLKLYYSESYATNTDPVAPSGWPHNPAGLYSMLTDSGLLYYAYSGNVAMTNLVRDVLTYQLDHGMTPSTWNWPGVAYASSDAEALTYQGASYGNSTGVGDGVGVIQPDKVGEIGVAFLKYFEFSGDVRFRDAAVQAADVLASHVRTGNATQSPWPFRVYAQTNSIREQYSAHVISPIQLFDELMRLNLGNVAAYQTARQTAWNWLMAYPMQNNVWANYFEDVAIRAGLDNVNQLNAAETARYLMRHQEFDPNWEAHVRGIISWIEATFAVPQFGANSIEEQVGFPHPMGSHTSRYASVNAQLYELTGDETAKEKAYRSLNWATYMCASNGVVIDGPAVNTVWWTDGYGDYIKHFMEGLGSVPEWAPQSQAHLLRATSVVRSIQYAPTDINYQVFDGFAQEVLRLNFTPQSVTVDGVLLPNRSDLAQQGWTFNSATGVMRVRHDAGTQLRISGSLNNNVPPDVSLDSPAPGNYLTPVSFNLTATATDSDGTIDHVEFLQNGATLATTFTPPYQFTWTSVPPGNYQLTAAAVDNQGARTTSSAVSVVVSSPALPPPPTNLVATVSGGTVNLTWSAPSGGPPVANYGIYRSTTSGFTPGAGNLIGQPTASPFSNGGLSPGTYYYRVVAFDANGNPSAASNEATATIAGSLQVDKVVFSDGGGSRTTPAFSTSTAGELLLAFAASDGPQTGGQTLTIAGAGLTWTLVTRMNAQLGSSEIWKAVAPGVLTNATVTSTASRTGFDQSLTVVTFSGAGGTAASAGASGVGAPAVSLTTTRAGSLVYGIGNDWDRAVARTVGASQAIVHQWVDIGAPATFWVQNRTTATGAAGTIAQLNDTAPTTDRWNFAAVEIIPPAALVTVPDTVGRLQAAAQSQITGASLVVGTVTNQPSTTAPINTVIAQSPTGGTQAATGSAVNLVLSSGVTVPNVVGQPRATAESQITGASLAVGTETNQSSATVPAGAVISQSPAGNTQASAGTAVDLVLSSGSPPPGVTIWNASATPAQIATSDSSAVELGVKFRADVSGSILGVRFYKGSTNTGTHMGRLWTNTGTLLATATFTNETASGWQQVAFSAPVAVTANTTYVASYHTNVGNYAVNVNYFTTTGVDNAPLHALATGVSGGNGVFIYGASAFPTQTFNASNYWVDVVFTSASDTTPPTVTSVTPASGATGVSAATTVTATFSEAMDAATLTTGTFVLRNPANTVVASTVSYNAGTRIGTLTPSAALAASTTYSATISGGGSGVKDLAGNALASNVVWSFTTGSQMVNVPNVIGQTQTAAQSQITGAGLAVGTVTSQPSTTAPINTVINQSPTGGTQAAAGSAVNLVISSGVTVPDVVGQPKATAESQITGAYLAVGTETNQSSPTVPSGAVISQSPSGNTQASAGTPVNLILSSGPSGVAAPTVDQTVSSDGSGTRTTPPFSTASAGEVLLAFAASDGPGSGGQTLTVSGAGLTWTLVKRINAQPGSSQIWWASATNILTNVTVTSTPSIAGYRQSLTVVTFRGATGVGASAAASAASGAPTVSLTTTKANALVYGVGNDWDGAVGRVPGTGQTLVHQWVETVAGDTFWVQARTAAISNSGTVVQVNDTSPTSDRWNLAAVEIVP